MLVLLLTYHETHYNLKYCAELPPTFWANHCPFYNYMSVTIIQEVCNYIHLPLHVLVFCICKQTHMACSSVPQSQQSYMASSSGTCLQNLTWHVQVVCVCNNLTWHVLVVSPCLQQSYMTCSSGLCWQQSYMACSSGQSVFATILHDMF